MPTQPFAIGFLGAGQMATALAKGWLAAGLLDPAKAMAADPHAPTREKFAAATGLTAVAENATVAAACDVLILAVKPHIVPAVFADLKSRLTRKHLLISIAAGVTLTDLTAAVPHGVRVIRVMPNTPALVGAAAAGYTAAPSIEDGDPELVGRLFNAVGTAYPMPESLLDAVTGLSGSGPAYVYVMIEALADGGVRMGLPRDVALKLAAQTVFGSAKMVLDTGTHPAALKDAVASPGGTTIAGLHEMERGGLRGILMDAVQAATERATELGRKG